MPSVPSVAVEAGQQVAKGFERARHAAAPCRERWLWLTTTMEEALVEASAMEEAEALSHLAATKTAARERRVVMDCRRSIVDFWGERRW